MRRLPPLNALRAFEAAARHQQVTRAATELNVTHGAVSHQIRNLEETLGTPLFQRSGNRIALTEAGRRLMPVVRDAFDRIAEAAAELAHSGAVETLTIACAPALAAKWLVPDINDLLERSPGLSIDIAPVQELAWSDGQTRPAPQGADITIAYGRPRPDTPGLVALPQITFFPVCSPRLLNGLQAIRRPRDVLRHLILHDDDGSGWMRWMAKAGITGAPDSRDMHLGHAGLALGAALDGIGVALGDTVLADADLAAGRLVAPFDIRVDAPGTYFMVLAPSAQRSPARASVATWLTDRLTEKLA